MPHPDTFPLEGEVVKRGAGEEAERKEEEERDRGR